VPKFAIQHRGISFNINDKHVALQNTAQVMRSFCVAAVAETAMDVRGTPP
jgi:hypothetical protein